MNSLAQSKKPSQIVTACQRCQARPAVDSKYCPSCGWELVQPFLRYHLRPKHLALLLIATVILWGFASSIQRSKAGTKPTLAYVAPNQATSAIATEMDQELKALKGLVEKEPQNLSANQKYSQALLAKIRSQLQPDPRLVFDTMEALNAVLKIAPSCSRYCLIKGAVISFC